MALWLLSFRHLTSQAKFQTYLGEWWFPHTAKIICTYTSVSCVEITWTCSDGALHCAFRAFSYIIQSSESQLMTTSNEARTALILRL